jgi:colanic acid/amylovoran biosynthesis glycosyltransferase
MKIGLVLLSTPAYSETFFRNKIQFLNATGYQVTVFSDAKPGSSSDVKVKYGLSLTKSRSKNFFRFFRAAIQLLLHWKTALRLFRLNQSDGLSLNNNLKSLLTSAHILEYKLDWIHFGFATAALGRENLAKAMDAKMAVSVRGYDIAIYPLKHQNCYWLVWQKIDKLHVISEDLLTLAYRNGLQNTTPVQKITPAIDTSIFQIKYHDTIKQSKPLRLLTVSRLNWKKGLNYTLEALAILKKNGIEFHYTLIGEGEELEHLIFSAHQLGINNQIDFKGKISNNLIKPIMEEADIYIQYSISEGFSNAVLEAQAMGLLCIVSDAEGLPENVLHEKTGWVVPKRQPALLAQQIKEISETPQIKTNTIRRNAIARIKKEFDIKQQCKEFLTFYQS